MDKVKIVDVEMSFLSMVKFMVKWAFAAIPAGIIIVMTWVFASWLVMATLRSM